MEVILVVGHSAQKITELAMGLSSQRLKVVFNPHYREGISTSIVAGVSKADPLTEGFMILLGDLPFLSSEAIDYLISQYEEGKGFLGASFWKEERIVHPVIFSSSLKKRLLTLSGDKGAREIVEELEKGGTLKKLQVQDHFSALGLDLDTQEDYQLILRELQSSSLSPKDKGKGERVRPHMGLRS